MSISIPLVRKKYEPLIANDFVSVQPTTSPASFTFYLRYRYSDQMTDEEKEEFKNARASWVIKNPVVIDPDVQAIDVFLGK